MGTKATRRLFYDFYIIPLLAGENGEPTGGLGRHSRSTTGSVRHANLAYRVVLIRPEIVWDNTAVAFASLTIDSCLGVQTAARLIGGRI